MVLCSRSLGNISKRRKAQRVKESQSVSLFGTFFDCGRRLRRHLHVHCVRDKRALEGAQSIVGRPRNLPLIPCREPVHATPSKLYTIKL